MDGGYDSLTNYCQACSQSPTGQILPCFACDNWTWVAGGWFKFMHTKITMIRMNTITKAAMKRSIIGRWTMKTKRDKLANFFAERCILGDARCSLKLVLIKLVLIVQLFLVSSTCGMESGGSLARAFREWGECHWDTSSPSMYYHNISLTWSAVRPCPQAQF